MLIQKTYPIFIFSLLVFSGLIGSQLFAFGQNSDSNAIPNSFAENNLEIEDREFLNQNLQQIELPDQESFSESSFNVPQRLRDNRNEYTQVWNPWLTKAGVHVSAVSEDGEFLAVGGGFLVDTTVHIYRWNLDEQEYQKVFEAGAGEIQSDILSIDFGDIDNNRLLDMAVASADGRVYLFEQSHIFDPTTQLDSKFDLVWKSPKLFRATSVQIADLDLDNIQDLIVGSWDNKVHIFEYRSRSGYPFSLEHWINLEEVWSSGELDDKVQSVSVTDLNGNDLPDFVVGTYSGSVYVYENDGVIADTATGQVPLPNDDTYTQLWNSSNRFQPIWNPIGNILADDVNGDGKDEAIIIAWGQGAWTFTYDNQNFMFEQMFRPFESWQIQGVYPLDNWADWMREENAINVFLDSGVSASSGDPNCQNNPNEPIFSCIKPFINSGSSEAPDGKFSRFLSNATHGAQAVWDIGEDEEIASNGNPSPDLYVIMDNGHAIPSEWNISVSNDLNTWFQINQSQITTGRVLSGGPSNLEIDLDPLFSLNRLTSVQYLKMQLLPASSLERRIDAIVVPYPAQPLTLAVSATIDTLPLSYDEADDPNQQKKIIFGGTDGRLIAYAIEPQTEIMHRSAYSLADIVSFDASSWDIELASTTQKWDSFVDEGFNLENTIWSIYKTPKPTFVPSWRKDSTTVSIGTSPHYQSAVFLEGHPQYEIYVSSANPLSNSKIGTYDSSSLLYDDSIFSSVNSFYDQAKFDSMVLTFAFGEFVGQNDGMELITIPHFASSSSIGQLPSFTTDNSPKLWEDTPGGFQASSLKMHPNFAPGQVVDQGNTLMSYLHSGETYPSIATGDIDGDGDTDIVASNGKLVLYENVGTPNNPSFVENLDYFNALNDLVGKDLIFGVQLWDHDRDGDLDLLYSLGTDSSGNRKYGSRLYANVGTPTNPDWEDKSEIVRNPTLQGNMVENKFTLGTVAVSSEDERSASALWVYQDNSSTIFKLNGEVGTQEGFIVGTNPEVRKIDVNKLVSPDRINIGYTVTTTWSNGDQFREWSSAMSVGILDGDENNEVVVADYDNNLYVFEHLSNNTYKRAFKSHDLNHTERTNKSPYRFQDFEGISGNFSKIVYEHATLLASGFDGDKDGLKEIALVAGLSVYIFESTEFNDQYQLIYGSYLGDKVTADGNFVKDKIHEITSISVIQNFNGLGPMIALSGGSFIFLMRNDQSLGWLETYQSLEGQETYEPLFADSSQVEIDSLLFSDVNQDNVTELWVAGYNATTFSPFLLAIESDILTYSIAFQFDTSIKEMERINVLMVSEDLDYDGLLELIIGHQLGVDIWEFNKTTEFQPERSEIISANPSYGASPNDILLGKNLSPFLVEGRSQDIFQLSNGKLIIVLGRGYNQTTNLPVSTFFGNDLLGDLAFAVVDDPLELSQNITKLSTDPLDLSQTAPSFEVANVNYTVSFEKGPDITEICLGGCSDGTPNGFAVVWTTVAVQTGTSTKFYFTSIQLMDVNGNRIGSTFHQPTLGNRGMYPSVIRDPTDENGLIVFTQENNRMVAYGFQFDNTGLTSAVVINQNTLGFDDYVIYSGDSIILDSNSADEVIGVVFSGFFENSTSGIAKLNYATLNSSIQVTGIYEISSTLNFDAKPKLIAGSRSNELITTYESQIWGLPPKVEITYSNDGGRSWSAAQKLETKAPNVVETENGVYETTNGVSIQHRSSTGPAITKDINGGLIFLAVERLILPLSSDPDFVNSSRVDLDGSGSISWMASHLIAGRIESTDFVQYLGITDVNKIATGDTDLDGRIEILVAVGKVAILVELDQVTSQGLSFVQKWESPEYKAEISDLAIFDANANGWSELIVSVKGGDVFSYELADTSQIPVNEFFLTTLDRALSINATIGGDPPYQVEATSLLTTQTGNGLEVTITNGLPSATRGAFTWSVSSDSIVRDLIMNGATLGYQFEDSRGVSYVLVSNQEIRIFDENWAQVFTAPFSPTHTSHHSLKLDVNNDGLDELVLAEKTRIFAIDPFDGSTIFEKIRANAQFFDLVTFEFNEEVFLAVADSNFTNYRTIEVFNSVGSSVSNYSIPVGNSVNSTMVLSDFNIDGVLDIALLDFETDGTSQLITYSLDTNDIVENPSVISNLTLPMKNAGIRSPITLKTADINGDGKSDVFVTVPEVSAGTGKNLLKPTKGVSAVFAVDVSDPTTLWARQFVHPINQVEMKDDILFVYVKDYGVQGLTLDGSDLFWAESVDPAVAEIISGQLIVVDRNASTSIFNFTGMLTNAQMTISTPLDLVGASTSSLYKVSDRISVFSYLVDITNNGIEDIITGFSNGTLALRNHEVGEYWRIRTEGFDTMVATSIRFSENRLGMAVYLSSGRLLVFNRLSEVPVINVTTPSGIVFEDLVTYDVGSRQNLVLKSPHSISVFDPSTEIYVWNTTRVEELGKVDVGAFDISSPGTNSHIIAVSKNQGVELIPLPTTLVPGGLISPPTSGIWINFDVVKGDSGLAEVILLSSEGDLRKLIWETNGTITQFSEQTPMIAQNFLLIGDQILVSAEGALFRFVVNDSNFTLLSQINHNYVGFSEIQMADFDQDGVLESLASFGNMVLTFNLNGSLYGIQSFSSDIVRLDVWTPDISGKPAILAVLSNEDVEISDPFDREFSDHIAQISSFEDEIVPQPDITVILPDPTWTEYTEPGLFEATLPSNDRMLFLLGIFAIGIGSAIAMAFIRRMRK